MQRLRARPLWSRGSRGANGELYPHSRAAAAAHGGGGGDALPADRAGGCDGDDDNDGCGSVWRSVWWSSGVADVGTHCTLHSSAQNSQ